MRLSQTIESHVSMQGSLQALLGRLELVLHASATSRGGGAERVAVEEADTMTTTVYSEATDAVDVLQDVMGRDRGEGGSVEEEEEEEWETDEEEDEGESDEDDESDEDESDMDV